MPRHDAPVRPLGAARSRRRLRAVLLALGVVVVAASGSGTARGTAGAHEEAAMETAWATTEALVDGAEVRAAVERLAAFERIDGAYVGPTGVSSEAYGAYLEVVAVSSPAERESLLRHASPVVRGYLAQYVAEHQHASLTALRPLLRDGTRVEGQIASFRDESTIAERVVNALCANAEAAAVAEALEAAAAEAAPDALRAQALVCLAPHRPNRAAARALPLLAHADASVRRYAVIAVAEAGEAGSLAALEGLVDDPDDSVRAAVATASARLGGRTAVVLDLLDDPEASVRRAAGRAYVAMGSVDEGVVRRLLTDPDAVVRNGVAEALAQHGLMLPLLEPLLMADDADDRITRTLAQRHDVAVAPLMRRLMEAPNANVRERATAWLGRHGDDGDLPGLRAKLAADTIGERVQAAQALALRQDVGAVGALETMLRSDPYPHGRVAAAEALVAIRGAHARSAVAAALVTEGTWARSALAAILDGIGADTAGTDPAGGQ